MGKDQHRFDVEDLLLESDVSDQTVFIATDVEYGQFTDLVYGIEGRLQFSPVVKSILLNHSSPDLQGLMTILVAVTSSCSDWRRRLCNLRVRFARE